MYDLATIKSRSIYSFFQYFVGASIMENFVFRFVKKAAQYNAEEDDVTYGITIFADLTEAEAELMRGFNATNIMNMSTSDKAKGYEAQAINPKFNLGYNHQSRYGPAKNQKRTKACWAFSATAVLEGHGAIVTGRYTAYSEQEVADCTPGSTVKSGGYQGRALLAVQETQHLATAADFPFTFRDGSYCNTNIRNALPYRITGVYLLKGDQGLIAALPSGPVASGMGFPDRLRAYKTGIYSNLECRHFLQSLFEFRNSVTSSLTTKRCSISDTTALKVLFFNFILNFISALCLLVLPILMKK